MRGVRCGGVVRRGRLGPKPRPPPFCLALILALPRTNPRFATHRPEPYVVAQCPPIVSNWGATWRGSADTGVVSRLPQNPPFGAQGNPRLSFPWHRWCCVRWVGLFGGVVVVLAARGRRGRCASGSGRRGRCAGGVVVPLPPLRLCLCRPLLFGSCRQPAPSSASHRCASLGAFLCSRVALLVVVLSWRLPAFLVFQFPPVPPLRPNGRCPPPSAFGLPGGNLHTHSHPP